MVTTSVKAEAQKQLITKDHFFIKDPGKYNVALHEYTFKENNELYKLYISEFKDGKIIAGIKIKENDKWFLFKATEQACNMDEAIKIVNKFYNQL